MRWAALAPFSVRLALCCCDFLPYACQSLSRGLLLRQGVTLLDTCPAMPHLLLGMVARGTSRRQS